MRTTLIKQLFVQAVLSNKMHIQSTLLRTNFMLHNAHKIRVYCTMLNCVGKCLLLGFYRLNNIILLMLKKNYQKKQSNKNL